MGLHSAGPGFYYASDTGKKDWMNNRFDYWRRLFLVGVAAAGLRLPAQAGTNAAGPAPAAGAAATNSPVEPLSRHLNRQRAQYNLALQRARAWLDNLDVDPLALRQHNVKGKKKLAECLDLYLRLYDLALPAEREALRATIEKRTLITREARYHDLAALTDLQFKEDATSYLRVAFLMERAGMDTALYREEIKKIQPRLDAHMVTRGTDQRMAFALYYRHFGLKEPFPLAGAFTAGLIASRRDPAAFANPMEVYSLTHEIFVPYQFGDKLDADFFSAGDKQYLRPTLDVLTRKFIKLGDPDVVAELSSCLSYLRFTDLPVYREALTYLLNVQQADGKWGNYEAYRPFYGDYVNQGFYLHTTLVAVDALSTAFQMLKLDAP